MTYPELPPFSDSFHWCRFCSKLTPHNPVSSACLNCDTIDQHLDQNKQTELPPALSSSIKFIDEYTFRHTAHAEAASDCLICNWRYVRYHLRTDHAKVAQAQLAFDDLRKADRESLTEALAAAIEQQQRAEKAETLRDEWCAEYTKVRDELAAANRRAEEAEQRVKELESEEYA